MRIFRGLFISVMAVGCASTPGPGPQGSAVSKKVTEMPVHYRAALVMVSSRNGKLEHYEKCPMQKSSSSFDWKKQVHFINACIQAGNWARAESLAGELAERESLAPWGAYYKSAVALEKTQLDKALWMAELALKKGPRLALVHYQKGRVLWAMGERSEALELFRESLKLDSNLVDAHLFLGQVSLAVQDYGLASRHFEAVLTAEPMNVHSIVGLAEIRVQQNDGREALELLSKAIMRQPENLDLRLRKAYVYETLERDVESALASYREIRQLMKAQRSWKPDFNLDEKIQSLESSLRSPASKRVSEARTQKGVSK